MTRLVFDPDLTLDIDRIASHLIRHEVQHVDVRIDEIFHALALLTQHPLIGRPATPGRRDLVIGKDARGYVARYRFDELTDTVIVMALRGQKEAGFVDR